MRYFVAIAEERSFTRAAERLWVAQPGLSTQIRRLEAELGVRLFERHTRGVDLTEAGELFLDRVRSALAAADLAASTGSDIEAGIVGTLRLGLSTPARWEAASRLLEAFMRTHPAIEVAVVESYGGALCRDLRDGRLDAVLAPSVFASADLRSISVGREPWVVLVGKQHKLAGDGPIDAGDLEGQEIVITGHRDGAVYDRAVIDTLSELGVTPTVRRGAPGPALLEPVARGTALALSSAPSGLDSELSIRPLNPPRSLGYELFWQSDPQSPALGELIRTAPGFARRLTPDTRPSLRAVA